MEYFSFNFEINKLKNSKKRMFDPLKMQIIVQLESKTKIIFRVLNNNILNYSYSLLINETDISQFYFDKDSTFYAFGQNTLFKVVDELIPLYYDIKCIYFGDETYFIANDFLIKKITDSNFQTIMKVPDDIAGISEYKNSFIFWNERCFYFRDKIIPVESGIVLVKHFRDNLYFINKKNTVYMLESQGYTEIIQLQSGNITDFCFNQYLPVMAFLGDESVFVLDVENKKIIKMISSYKATKIDFQNKRELIFINKEHLSSYHLGKNTLNTLLEAKDSDLFFFELKKEFTPFPDTFKEEIRSKLIENKIENKRMVYKLMNEVEDLKKKMSDFQKDLRP